MEKLSYSALPGQFTPDQEDYMLLLRNFRHELVTTGRVCPRPWHWARFYFAFRPGYESIWLMDWWQTPDRVKRQRLLDQLQDLARNSGDFNAAYRFLVSLDSRNWHYQR